MRKTTTPWLGALLLLGIAAGAPVKAQGYPVYFAPDIPVRGVAAFDMMPWQIILYVPINSTYTLVHSLPGQPPLDGIFKMPSATIRFLFSVAAANKLDGVLGGEYADPRDIVLFDGPTGTYSRFFCGDSAGIPPGANVDTCYLEGGEAGNLVVSFDIPLSIGEASFGPSDLVRFRRTGLTCGDWTLDALPRVFDASAAGVPPGVNVRGADRAFGDDIVMAFDVPVRIGGEPYVTGDIVRWDGLTLSRLEHLASWPAHAIPLGVSTLKNLGQVEIVALRVDAGGQLRIEWNWAAACPGDVFGFGLYEGRIGSWYSHTAISCATPAGPEPYSLIFTPNAGNRYFLVAPFHPQREGSYGQRSAASQERPPGQERCALAQQPSGLCP